jgi:Xaa-Pro aminopeptidase
MVRDTDRVARIARALESARLDALVCTLPSNVLMASGYWPVIGTAFVIATCDGRVAVLAPKDEEPLASGGWADVLRVFSGGSLDAITDVVDVVRRPLAELASAAGLRSGAAIGVEGASFDPSVYAAGFAYGASLPPLLSSALPDAVLSDATDVFARLKSTLTAREVAAVRTSCGIARTAFETVVARIGAGMSEHEVAELLRRGFQHPEHDRADGYAYCMSGPNAARAYAAFQRSSSRTIAPGDQVLLHGNSCCSGFWTDITRTLSLGPPRPEMRARVDAILTARRHAIDAVRPGVPASAVDRAARAVMEDAGFADEFVHPTGHGVGFAAINHDALPRIHPRSEDVLEAGMTFNIEPAAYRSNAFGIRHCDMVVVTDTGADVLTPFLSAPEALALSPARRAAS